MKSFLRELRQPPNCFTAIRMFSIPILWVLALMGVSTAIGLGLILGGVTDVLDGLAARRMNRVSAFGSRFDSIADHSLQLSAVVWLSMLVPAVFRENGGLVFSALGMNLLSLFIGIVKFRRIANLHLYLSKAAYFLFLVFMVHAFLARQYSPALLLLACGGVILASIETIALQLLSQRVDEHMGSIVLVFLRPEHRKRGLRQVTPGDGEVGLRQESANAGGDQAHSG